MEANNPLSWLFRPYLLERSPHAVYAENYKRYESLPQSIPKETYQQLLEQTYGEELAKKLLNDNSDYRYSADATRTTVLHNPTILQRVVRHAYGQQETDPQRSAAPRSTSGVRKVAAAAHDLRSKPLSRTQPQASKSRLARLIEGKDLVESISRAAIPNDPLMIVQDNKIEPTSPEKNAAKVQTSEAPATLSPRLAAKTPSTPSQIYEQALQTEQTERVRAAFAACRDTSTEDERAILATLEAAQMSIVESASGLSVERTDEVSLSVVVTEIDENGFRVEALPMDAMHQKVDTGELWSGDATRVIFDTLMLLDESLCVPRLLAHVCYQRRLRLTGEQRRFARAMPRASVCSWASRRLGSTELHR